MNLEELLNCSAKKLASLSDEELTSYLSKYFTVTRPEKLKEAKVVNHSTPASEEKARKLKRAAELAKSLGVDIGL